MPIGPGIYDHLCTYVREEAKAEGAIVLVFGGDKGSGFSVQADPIHIMKIPDILRQIAKNIESSVNPAGGVN